MFRGLCDFLDAKTHMLIDFLVTFSGHRSYGSRYEVFNLSRDLVRPEDQGVLWIIEEILLYVTTLPSVVTIVIVETYSIQLVTWSCKTTRSRDHVTYRRNLIECNHPAKCGDHSHSGDILYSVCHVTMWGYMIKGSCDIIEGSSSLYVTTPPGAVKIGSVVREKYFLFITWTHLTTISKGCVTLWVEDSHSKSPPCQVWWSEALW